jgi:hypothetical protein
MSHGVVPHASCYCARPFRRIGIPLRIPVVGPLEQIGRAPPRCELMILIFGWGAMLSGAELKNSTTVTLNSRD